MESNNNNNNNNGKASSSLERNKVEKERRIKMNLLYSQLSSLIPLQCQLHHPQGKISQADKVAQAMHYIMELKENIKRMMERKEQLRNMISEERKANVDEHDDYDDIISDDDEIMMNSDSITSLPIIRLTQVGDVVDLHMVTPIERNLKLGQLIRVFEEEGAEIVYSTYSVQEDKVVHTIYAKVQNSQIGKATPRVQQRLQELV